MSEEQAPQRKKKKNDGVIDRTGWWVLVATTTASSMAFISGSALNVAQPALQRTLDATGGDLLWIINSYALFLAALLLVGGSLGDHFGRKRVYMIGIVVFIAASVACGLSWNPASLIFFRAIQGVGGALMVPGSLAIISAYFDDSTRGKAIGTWASVTTLTSLLGPIIGGVLAEQDLWRLIFFINIPLAVVAIITLIRYVPESYDEEASPQLDYIGAAIVTLGLAGITYGSIRIGEVGAEAGFSNPFFVGSLIGGLVLIVVFVFWEGRSDHPMMPLWLFRSRTFTGANLLTLFLYGALGAGLLFLPLNLVQVQGYGETLAALATLPLSILLTIFSRFMGDVVDAYGPRIPLISGPIIAGFGFLLLAAPGITDGPSSYWWTFFPAVTVFGIGMGITVSPLTTSVMSAVPQHSSGIASGVNNAMSRSSQVLATSIIGGIALIVFSTSLMTEVEALSLSDDARATLVESAEDLGATEAPAGLDETTTQQVERAVDVAFVAMFRQLMLICAGLCFVSGAMAFLTIAQDPSPSDELLEAAQPANLSGIS